MGDIIERIANVHTLKGIGVALAGAGLLPSDAVEKVIEASGGNVMMIVAGLGFYVVCQFLRR